MLNVDDLLKCMNSIDLFLHFLFITTHNFFPLFLQTILLQFFYPFFISQKEVTHKAVKQDIKTFLLVFFMHHHRTKFIVTNVISTTA